MKKTLIAVLLACAIVPAHALTEGVDYEKMPVEVEPVQEDKIEVTEFFAYWCPHCADLEPVISKHVRTFASDTVLRKEHIIWDEGRDFNFARLYAAAKQSGLEHQVTPAVFEAVVRQRINLGQTDTLSKWANAQTRFDGKKLISAFESFGSQTQAKQMGELTAKYGIDGTPTVVVGGKYRVLFKNGYESGMKTIDELVQKVRQERGMKQPAPKVAVKSINASLINGLVKPSH